MRKIGHFKQGVRRINIFKVGRIPSALVALIIGALVGSVVLLAQPAKYATVNQVIPSDPSADKISSANSSVNDAKFMFSLMSSALTDSTGSIKTVVAGVDQVFDAVDKANSGAKQLSTAFDSAPNFSAAAGRVGPITNSISSALQQAQGLTSSTKQIDEFVTPLIRFLDRSNIPGTADARARLKSLQAAARSMTTQLGSIDQIQQSLTSINGSIGQSAQGVDASLQSGKQSAQRLEQGLSTMANARPEVRAAAKKITDGVEQLNRVLKSIEANLTSASDALTPKGEQISPAFSSKGYPDNTNRIARSVAAGAVAALLTLAAVAAVSRRRRALQREPEIAQYADDDTGPLKVDRILIKQ